MIVIISFSKRLHEANCSICITSVFMLGKTTLIKALTGDAKLEPRDQLFATLDITAHAGYLPSRLTVLYVDTIGFLSQLPHNLLDSFSATLEDVACSVSTTAVTYFLVHSFILWIQKRITGPFLI